MRLTRYGLTVIGVISIGANSCTPSAVQLTELAPIPDSAVVTADVLFAKADPATRAKEPANAAEIVIVHGDSVIAAISIYELEDIFWADIYVYNNGSSAFVLNPSQLVLMDGARTAFRQLMPNEAANIYAARVGSIPPYQPKYTYSAYSSTQGYLYLNGNYGTYNGTTQTTVTRQEDPYNALGYSIGAAIAAHRNTKYRNMAGALYALGFVEGSSVAGKTGARGGVYWLKRTGWIGPLTLRLVQSGYEVRFAGGR